MPFTPFSDRLDMHGCCMDTPIYQSKQCNIPISYATIDCVLKRGALNHGLQFTKVFSAKLPVVLIRQTLLPPKFSCIRYIYNIRDSFVTIHN